MHSAGIPNETIRGAAGKKMDLPGIDSNLLVLDAHLLMLRILGSPWLAVPSGLFIPNSVRSPEELCRISILWWKVMPCSAEALQNPV